MDMVAVVVIQNEEVVVAPAGWNNELSSLVTESFATGDGDDGCVAGVGSVASVISGEVILMGSILWQ